MDVRRRFVLIEADEAFQHSFQICLFRLRALSVGSPQILINAFDNRDVVARPLVDQQIGWGHLYLELQKLGGVALYALWLSAVPNFPR